MGLANAGGLPISNGSDSPISGKTSQQLQSGNTSSPISTGSSYGGNTFSFGPRPAVDNNTLYIVGAAAGLAILYMILKKKG